jgi:hypothetical protein
MASKCCLYYGAHFERFVAYLNKGTDDEVEQRTREALIEAINNAPQATPPPS